MILQFKYHSVFIVNFELPFSHIFSTNEINFSKISINTYFIMYLCILTIFNFILYS